MDFVEVIRRWKRGFDNYITYRRLLILLIVAFCLILYISPTVFNWFSHSPKQYQDIIDRCLEDRLTAFHIETLEFNANVRHIPRGPDDTSYLPFVGNGLFGLIISSDSPIFIKSSRTLSLPVQWRPIISVDVGERFKEAVATRFLNGVSTRFQCFDSGLHVTYHYYAHRTLPNLFVQNIKIVNPSIHPTKVTITQPSQSSWPTATEQKIRVPQGRAGPMEYQTISGIVEDPSLKNEKVLGVSITSRIIPTMLEIGSHETVELQALTTIFIETVKRWEFFDRRKGFEDKTLELIKKYGAVNPAILKQQHIDVWNKLWSTGLSISYSKAAGAINGDKINATIYYVLSNVRSLLYEVDMTPEAKNELSKPLEYPEGCYGGLHHTFQAMNLWGSLVTFNEITKIVSIWLLTLEKQGCHKLIESGADGVIQAMVLSFGSFRFSPHHLEFNIHPKFLHRDYFFRRINYGSQTHINVSVTLQENNKAVLGVSLDRSDKTYYACDGGCIDEPVQLGSSVTHFPVKLTEPITSILYVTSDKMHMELMKHTLHVKEIVEAPAHEHHIIALHRHGHHLGGLPTLFWASVCFLIIVFHLFLFKLIYNEYCGRQDKFRNRYGKF